MQELDPKTDGRTVDIIADNIEKLKVLFPEAFTEGKVDFDALREVLGDYIGDREERYSFSWNGKSKARWLAQTPSTGTLRPSPEESVNWNDTQNLFIEGDNLEVLKLLQKSYHKKVKMIYIDPPYNTGKDFIYPDNFQDNINNYLELTGQVDSEGRKKFTNAETSGRYHTDWLNMMYPRLKLARNLLRDDGVIFISIDDNEYDNLKKLCSEIFGEENYIGTFVWRKKVGAGADSRYFFRQHEEILLFAKNLIEIEYLFQSLNEDQKKEYSNPDNDPRGKWAPTDLGAPAHDNDPKRIYDAISPSGKVFRKCWAYTKENFEKLCSENLVYWGKNENSMPKRKRFLKDKKGLTPRSWVDFCLTSDGKKDILELDIKIFDYPKPVKLIKHLLNIGTHSNDIILDFFAGSATTAHAVLDLNNDNGNRKFIMVQLPEPCDEKTEAFKTGYTTIAEIGKERIRRVITKIKEQSPKYKGDLGFKVFKLDSTNIKPWEADYDNLERTLDDYVSNIKDDRSEHDILYEILLKYGLDLTLPIEERTVDGKAVFVIGYGALVICLADDISLETVEGIASLKEELQPELMRVVFKDNGFKDDVVKTNAVQILRQNGIDDVKSV